jgi:hypothetical protein
MASKLTYEKHIGYTKNIDDILARYYPHYGRKSTTREKSLEIIEQTPTPEPLIEEDEDIKTPSSSLESNSDHDGFNEEID